MDHLTSYRIIMMAGDWQKAPSYSPGNRICHFLATSSSYRASNGSSLLLPGQIVPRSSPLYRRVDPYLARSPTSTRWQPAARNYFALDQRLRWQVHRLALLGE